MCRVTSAIVNYLTQLQNGDEVPSNDRAVCALFDYIRNIAFHFTQARPTMVAIGNAVCSFAARFFQDCSLPFSWKLETPKTPQAITSSNVNAVLSKTKQLSEHFLSSLDACNQAIASNFSSAITKGSTILTLSLSSTVINALASCFHKELKVIVSGSCLSSCYDAH